MGGGLLRVRVVVGTCLLAVLAAGCSEDAESPAPGVTPLAGDANGTQPLQPGQYGLTANGAPDVPLAVVTVPGKLFGYGGFGVGVFPDSPGDEPYRTLTYWTVTGVFADPCSKEGGAASAGSSVADLVAAFEAQRLMRTTPPRPVSIDGYDGVQFDLVAPTDVVFEDCAEDVFALWDSSPDGGRILQEPGQLVRMRVLDVDGKRVVISTSAIPGKGDAEFAALDQLAEGVRFVPSD